MKRSDIPDALVCKACRDFHMTRTGPNSLDILIALTGAPEKVAASAMQRACNRGLIEYGVSLRTAWITPEGATLLPLAAAK